MQIKKQFRQDLLSLEWQRDSAPSAKHSSEEIKNVFEEIKELEKLHLQLSESKLSDRLRTLFDAGGRYITTQILYVYNLYVAETDLQKKGELLQSLFGIGGGCIRGDKMLMIGAIKMHHQILNAHPLASLIIGKVDSYVRNNINIGEREALLSHQWAMKEALRGLRLKNNQLFDTEFYNVPICTLSDLINSASYDIKYKYVLEYIEKLIPSNIKNATAADVLLVIMERRGLDTVDPFLSQLTALQSGMAEWNLKRIKNKASAADEFREYLAQEYKFIIEVQDVFNELAIAEISKVKGKTLDLKKTRRDIEYKCEKYENKLMNEHIATDKSEKYSRKLGREENEIAEQSGKISIYKQELREVYSKITAHDMSKAAPVCEYRKNNHIITDPPKKSKSGCFRRGK